ncbi:hypothetical protein ACI2OX_03990 [Bacillus sp. N9]
MGQLTIKGIIAWITVNLMTLVDNGDIYYVQGADLYKLPKINDR